MTVGITDDSKFSVSTDRLKPCFPVIRNDTPTSEELEQSKRLEQYMNEHYPTEIEEKMTLRSVILSNLRKIFREWVKRVCIEKGIPEDVAAEAGGQIYVSGSYRLGVNEPGADIDTICVAPKHVDRADFFSSLKEVLLQQPQITNMVSIEGAIVPLLTFDYEEVNIDLQIAILPLNSVLDNLNILEDSILHGVDFATEKSLNGPRVTELMIKLTPNRESFIIVLRIVRRWAKRRGLYSNKMGYLGGVNWCILACFVNQLYPTATSSALLYRFFMVLSQWKWPSPVQLCQRYNANLGLEVWDPQVGGNRYHIMPILTPAYPSMNSSVSVSSHSLQVMKHEFSRAHDIVKEILDNDEDNWDKLFEVSDFFAIYPHYLAVDLHAANEEDKNAWCGFCESRLRKLVESLAYLPPLRNIRAYPKKFPLCFIKEEVSYGTCFFVGFDVDKQLLHNSKELRIDSSVDYFKNNDLYRWKDRKEGMDVKITPCSWKSLPDVVFEELGGRQAARAIRRAHVKAKKEKLDHIKETAEAMKKEKEKERDEKLKQAETTEVALSEDAGTQPVSKETRCREEGHQDAAKGTKCTGDSGESGQQTEVKDTSKDPAPAKLPAAVMKPPPVGLVMTSAVVGSKGLDNRPKKKMKISFGKKK